MSEFLDRRAFLRATVLRATVLLAGSTLTLKGRAQSQSLDDARARFAQLEKANGGRLGVYALDTATGAQLRYRAAQRFPMLSTFKVMAVGAILDRNSRDSGLLQRHIRYTKANLVDYSPITETHVAQGMTVEDLCAAALQYSDNTAGNLLMRIIGGPAFVTAFARSIGDGEFALDRWETQLNTAIPGDLRDTTTPAAMGQSLRALTLGDALPAAQKARLIEWMRGNTTGDKRIRAAVAASWQVADKTGSGDYGTANDVAVLFPPRRAPIVLAIYSTREKVGAARNDKLVADAAKIVVEQWRASLFAATTKGKRKLAKFARE